MKKKTIILTLVMLTLCMILSACNHNSAKNTEKSRATVSGSTGKVKNTLIAGNLEQNSVETEARRHWTHSSGYRNTRDTVRKHVQYKHYSSLNTMQMELSADRVDYLQLPSSVANYLAASDNKLKVEMGLALQDYHMAVRADDTALYEKINNAIDALKADGSLDQLTTNYITKADSAPTANALKKHEGAKTYVVAVTGDLPPLDYVSADGKPAGFNVALLNAISEKCGCNFKIVQLDAAARLSALKSRKVDLIFWIGCFNSKDFEPKADDISLSTPYFEEHISWVSYSADILNKVKLIYKNEK